MKREQKDENTASNVAWVPGEVPGEVQVDGAPLIADNSLWKQKQKIKQLSAQEWKRREEDLVESQGCLEA